MSKIPREYTCNLIEMMEVGLISPHRVALMALSFLSESDVCDMIQAEDLTEDVNRHRRNFGYRGKIE